MRFVLVLVAISLLCGMVSADKDVDLCAGPGSYDEYSVKVDSVTGENGCVREDISIFLGEDDTYF
jgi:hypothetical protein